MRLKLYTPFKKHKQYDIFVTIEKFYKIERDREITNEVSIVLPLPLSF